MSSVFSLTILIIKSVKISCPLTDTLIKQMPVVFATSLPSAFTYAIPGLLDSNSNSGTEALLG